MLIPWSPNVAITSSRALPPKVQRTKRQNPLTQKSQILPTEVCIEILSLLSPTDILATCLVSKAWKTLATNPIIWRAAYAKQAPRWDFKFDFLKPNTRLDWHRVFRIRHILESNWKRGKCVKKTYSWAAHDRHKDSVYAIQCDLSHNVVISGSRDRTVKVWDLKTKSCLKSWKHHQGSILCLDIDLARNLVVTGSSDCQVVVWDYAADQVRAILPDGHSSSVFNVRIWNNYVISCSKDYTIRVWNLKTFQLVHVLHGHSGAVNAIAVANGQIASGSSDKTVKLWDVETGECLNTFIGHTHGVACISFDGKTITSGSNDRTIRMFDAVSGSWLNTIYDAHQDLIRTIALHGDILVTGSYDQTIKVWKRRPQHGTRVRPSALSKPCLSGAVSSGASVSSDQESITSIDSTDSTDSAASSASSTTSNESDTSPPCSPSTLKRVAFLDRKPSVAVINKNLPTSRQQTWEVMYELRSQDWTPSFGRVYNVCCTSRHLIASSEQSSIACWDFGEGVSHMNMLSKYF